MKKLVVSLIIGASLAIAPSAFALKAMTADNMKDTTGQAGVSIAVDNITIFNGASTTIYTDFVQPDATGEDLSGGSIMVEATGGYTTLRGILDDTQRGTYLKYAYGTDLVAAGLSNMDVAVDGTQAAGFQAQPLSIDVTNALQTLTAGKSYNMGAVVPIAGIAIGLPTLEICKSMSIKTYSVTRSAAANNDLSYIRVEKTASTMAILGGSLEIAPH